MGRRRPNRPGASCEGSLVDLNGMPGDYIDYPGVKRLIQFVTGDTWIVIGGAGDYDKATLQAVAQSIVDLVRSAEPFDPRRARIARDARRRCRRSRCPAALHGRASLGRNADQPRRPRAVAPTRCVFRHPGKRALQPRRGADRRDGIDLRETAKRWTVGPIHEIDVVNGVDNLLQGSSDGSLVASWIRLDGGSKILTWVKVRRPLSVGRSREHSRSSKPSRSRPTSSPREADPAALRWRHDHVRPPHAPNPLRRPGARAASRSSSSRSSSAARAYEPQPNPAPAELKVTRASSGTVLELAFDVSLEGPCFRCLQDAELALQLRLREYEATKPESDDERTEYLEDDRVDLSAWAHDAIALALPDKILCRADCAGLCPVCGKDLNLEPHEHVEERADPRWAALEALREGRVATSGRSRTCPGSARRRPRPAGTPARAARDPRRSARRPTAAAFSSR